MNIFVRDPTTDSSIITTEHNPNTLTLDQILNKYLDLETIRWDELITLDRWDDGSRQGIEFEQRRHSITHEANNRRKKHLAQASIVLQYPNLGLPIPRTEASLTLNLPRKIPKSKRSKKKLNGLYDILAPV